MEDGCGQEPVTIFWFGFLGAKYILVSTLKNGLEKMMERMESELKNPN